MKREQEKPLTERQQQRDREQGAGLKFATMSSQEIVFRNGSYFRISHVDYMMLTMSFNYRFSSF